MLLAYNKPRLLVFPKTIDFFFVISFLYFFTLHADLLQMRVAGFAVRLNNLFGIALFIAMMLRYRKEFFTIRKEIAIPLIALTLSILISLLFSPYKKRCLVFFFFYGLTILCYFWLPYQMMHKFGTKKILRAYFLSFFCVGLLTLPQLITFAKTHLRIRPQALTYEPSFYALYMTPFIIMISFHYFFNQESDFFLCRKLKKKLLFFIHFLFFICCSTSAFVTYLLLLGLSSTLLLYPKFKTYKKTVLKFLISAGALFGILIALFTKYVLSIILKIISPKFFLRHHSFTERFIAAKASFITFLEHPIAGIGLGGFPHYRMEKWLAGDPNFVHYLTRNGILHDFRPLRFFESSNVLTELLASLGSFGMIAVALFCISFTYLAKKASKFSYMWTWNFFFSTLVMLTILQINQGLLRSYVWVHVALAYAYFAKTIQLFEQDPLEERAV
ncbi:MAG: hypothetical protein S4CHLAM45_10230 [Chlamydiales bacterium]|nr:hypothetical protein [Chlamydiales bacterium]MCH9619518.1 hypothetical protein [Chlamydiales bacterium]MCH9623124.1 hypothetical protein [Chlamydiales bacterium]